MPTLNKVSCILYLVSVKRGGGASCGVAHNELIMPNGVELSNLTISTVYQSHSFKDMTLYMIFNNVVCATSKASDQPAQTRSLI